MNVTTQGRLRAGSVVWQSGLGQWTMTVVAKATFLLLPGSSPRSPEPDELHAEDEYWHGDERCSLRAAADLVPFKAGVDVLVTGHARAPAGRPARSLVARIAVGDVNKAVEVCCDRVLAPDGTIHDGPPFTTMPLFWERAGGGPETVNPVGLRPDTIAPDGTTAIPNLQPVGFRLGRRGEPVPPVGLGPIAPWWPPRRGRLHAGLGGWDFRRWNRGPLPVYLDQAFFNAAPADQQMATLAPDARLVLEHLHPEHPYLLTTLAATPVSAVVEMAGSAAHEIALVCDTLVVDADRGTCALTYRAAIPLAYASVEGRVVVLARRTDPAPRGDPSRRTQVGEIGPIETLPVLPFRIAGPGAPPPPSPIEDDEASVRTLHGVVLQREILPFTPAPVLPPAHEEPALPSGAPVRATPAPPSAWPFAAGYTLPPEPARVLPFEPTPRQPDTASPPHAVDISPPSFIPSPPIDISPPPFIPSAPVDLSPPSPPLGPALPAQAKPEIAPPPAPPGGALPPLSAFPIERYAAIAASVARRRERADEVLAQNDLTIEAWTALDRHWSEAIDRETARGKRGLLVAHDRAYVERLAEERGPITVEEHARLVVAAERDELAEAMEAMGLPPAAYMRIRRVWMARCAADSRLGAGMRRAVAAERER